MKHLLRYLLAILLFVPSMSHAGFFAGSHGSSFGLITVETQGFTDPDVAHGMTDIAATTYYMYVAPISGTVGGGDIFGLSDATQDGALRLTGIIGAADPTDTHTALHLRGGKKSGTGWAALGAAETVFRLSNYTTDLVTVLGDGKVGIGIATPSGVLDVQAPGAHSLLTSTTGTGIVYHTYVNTGGNFHIGRDSSTGGDLVGGGIAYAGVVNVASAHPLQFATNNTVNMTILSGGNILTGGLTAAGTTAAKNIVVGEGTAPTASVANGTHLWSADVGGVAGSNGLHMRDEAGNNGPVAFAKTPEYIISATGNVTAEKMYGGLINTYGQTDDAVLSLATIAQGMNFCVVVGTTVAKYLRIDPDANTSIYDGSTTAGDGKYFGVASAAVGQKICFEAFTTGASAYDWSVSYMGPWLSE